MSVSPVLGRAVRDDPLRKSVVKLFTAKRKPDYYQPWAFGHQRPSGGSGCVVDGRRILTNAHVVRNAIFIQALKTGDVKSSCSGVLREGDVLLSLGGCRIERDGSIQLRGEDRVGFSYLVSQRLVGESL